MHPAARLLLRPPTRAQENRNSASIISLLQRDLNESQTQLSAAASEKARLAKSVTAAETAIAKAKLAA